MTSFINIYCYLISLRDTAIIANPININSRLIREAIEIYTDNINQCPPGFLLEDNAYFALYPVDKFICPYIEERDIQFKLYTKKNPTNYQLLVPGQDGSLRNSNLNFSNPTVIYFHGFLETDASSPKFILVGYRRSNFHNQNVIILDAHRLTAGPWYSTSVRNVQTIGKYSAKFIDYLVSRGLKLEKLHLIGHSLGAQMAGITGHNVKSGKIARITGLDPARPLFENVPFELRLDASDAKSVDNIHTDGGMFGMDMPIGHADFYPNGGKARQPGCTMSEIFRTSPTSLMEQVFCSHWRSFFYYIESTKNPKSFLSIKCDSWNQFKTQKCSSKKDQTYMGFAASSRARGKYYLVTNANPPYSK